MSLQEAQARNQQLSRNDACTCGIAKKYKKCCQAADDLLIAQAVQAEALKAEAAREAAQAEADEKAEANGEKEEGPKDAQRKASRPRTKSKLGSAHSARKGKASQSLPRRGAV